jgi:preprotein translocase subunit SecE
LAEEIKKAKAGVLARVSKSARDMRGEMKKVVWPTKKQTFNNTVVVLCFMAVMAVLIGLFDAGLSALVRLMVGA